MSIAQFTINLILLFVSLLIYINRKLNIEVTLFQKCLALYIWLISLLPLTFLTSELSELDHPNSESNSHLYLISILWSTYYYLNLINGYFILPLVISYLLSGYFSFKRKILDSIITNVVFYLVTFFFCLIVYALANYRYTLDLVEVKIIVPKFVNTVGYFLYAFLLSYGLYRLPLRHLRMNFYLKIHENLKTLESIKCEYKSLISTLIQFYHTYEDELATNFTIDELKVIEDYFVKARVLILRKVFEREIVGVRKSEVRLNLNDFESIVDFHKQLRITFLNFQIVREIYYETILQTIYLFHILGQISPNHEILNMTPNHELMNQLLLFFPKNQDIITRNIFSHFLPFLGLIIRACVL